MIYDGNIQTRNPKNLVEPGSYIASCCGCLLAGGTTEVEKYDPEEDDFYYENQEVNFDDFKWGIVVQEGEHGTDRADDGISVVNHVPTSNGILSIKQRYNWGDYEYPEQHQ